MSAEELFDALSVPCTSPEHPRPQHKESVDGNRLSGCLAHDLLEDVITILPRHAQRPIIDIKGGGREARLLVLSYGIRFLYRAMLNDRMHVLGCCVMQVHLLYDLAGLGSFVNQTSVAGKYQVENCNDYETHGSR
jgi:hypothetical protein